MAVRLQALAPSLLVGLTLVVLLKVSVTSVVAMGVAVALAALLVLVTARGLEGAAATLIGLGILLSPMDDLKPVSALDFASVSDFVLLVGIALLIPTLLTRPAPAEGLFLIGVAGFLMIAVVTSVINPQPEDSLVSLLRLVVGALLLPIVFALWRPRRERVVWFVAAYVAGVTFNVISAYWNGVGDGGRRIGYSSHPNALGLGAVLALALVPFLVAAVPKRLRLLALVGGAACAWGIWISGSRAALLVAAAVAVLYVVASRSVGVALAVFGAAIPTLYFVADAVLSGERDSGNALGRLLGGGSAQGSTQAREDLADRALHVFLDHPILGSGLSEVMAAHNIYLQIAAAVGLVGGAFYLIILASTIVRSLSLPQPWSLLVLPCLGYAMIGLLTPILWDRYVWVVLALPFLVAVRPTETDPDDVDVSLHPHSVKEPA